MGASKKMAMHDKRVHDMEMLSGTRRSAMVDLVSCQRCGRAYVPTDYEVCLTCVDELDHNMEIEESYEEY